MQTSSIRLGDPDLRFIELSHPLHAEIPIWPGGEPFELENLAMHGDGYYANRFRMGEHSGTHMDAPLHFVAGRPSIDEVPARQLFAPVVLLDVAVQSAKDPDYEVSIEDLGAWESRWGTIPAGAVVLAYTGWAERWAAPQRYLNQDEAEVMHFPGFSRGAAELLVTRGVVGLGIDTMSLDPGRSQTFDVHQVTGEADIYLLENLTDLELLPASGAWIVVAPLRIRGGSGSPVRVLALAR